MEEIAPRHTKVEKIITATVGNVILENPVGYPRSESNLYCLDSAGKLIWFSEFPEAGVHYSRVRFDDQGEKLLTYSVSGHACEIDLKTGKILNKVLIK